MALAIAGYLCVQPSPLRPYPWRQGGCLDASPARYTARHGGRRDWLPDRRMRLLEMVDLADMLGRMGDLERDALAMPAGRAAPTLDHRHLVRHSRMRGSWVMV